LPTSSFTSSCLQTFRSSRDEGSTKEFVEAIYQLLTHVAQQADPTFIVWINAASMAFVLLTLYPVDIDMEYIRMDDAIPTQPLADIIERDRRAGLYTAVDVVSSREQMVVELQMRLDAVMKMRKFNRQQFRRAQREFWHHQGKGQVGDGG